MTLARHMMFAKQAIVERTHTSKLELAREYSCRQPCGFVSSTKSCLMGHNAHRDTMASCRRRVVQNTTPAITPMSGYDSLGVRAGPTRV